MMAFFTEIQIPESSSKMDYSGNIMFIGSCFAENIGQRMIDLKYKVDMNPFGILYNPESIANSLKMLLENRIFTEADLFQDQGLWNSFFHHSRFSDVDKCKVLNQMNHRLASSGEFLKKAEFLEITFGTSSAYELHGTGQIVSNCHKLAASNFNRIRLTQQDITSTFTSLLNDLWTLNPNLKVVFTISPIRHWKDGATQNQISKATLFLAIDHLMTCYQDRALTYFPAYELMMDELRDYRFYAEDMIHLSQVAVDHIFDRFSRYLIDKDSLLVSKKVLKIRKSMLHRPGNGESAGYERFLRQTLDDILNLIQEVPRIDFSEEIAVIEERLQRFNNQTVHE